MQEICPAPQSAAQLQNSNFGFYYRRMSAALSSCFRPPGNGRTGGAASAASRLRLFWIPAWRPMVWGLVLALGAHFMNSHLPANPVPAPPTTQRATFGGGCFWCVEAAFETLPGVISVTAGYAGGATSNPTYPEVCSGKTGHAEVVQIEFDPARIRFERLVDFFWDIHDPTTRNRQGGDIGTQYRSIILYHDEAQRKAAQASLLAAASRFPRPIVTAIEPLAAFYPAEAYHQDYFRQHPDAPYCAAVIRPKLEKLEKLAHRPK